MLTVAWWAVGSGIGLALLIVLFHIETARGQRFLSSARLLIDRAVVVVGNSLRRYSLRLGLGTLRVALLFVINRALRKMQRGFVRLSEYLVRLQERNRRVAREIRTDREANHLDAIHEHKQETSLSPRERKRLKQEKLEG